MFSEGQKPFVWKRQFVRFIVCSLTDIFPFVCLVFVWGGSHAATEGSSEFSASDLDIRCRRSYRSRKQEVNYCETSDSDGSQASTNKDKKKKNADVFPAPTAKVSAVYTNAFSQHKAQLLYNFAFWLIEVF